MATISLCMIVKNEEKILARCLDSIYDLMDEIIIVDTGSTDRTKEIASGYTEKVFDFKWTDDFSAARNFAFSMAGCEYIYSADADEVLNRDNHSKFKLLKENVLPEVEIVQMFYGNQLACGSVYNFNRELRPKLFKRLRTFHWIDPVHETLRLLPVVYDSDIEITHLPEKNHAQRDLAIFEAVTQKGQKLSSRLSNMYAREVFLSGTDTELFQAEAYFTLAADGEETEPEQMKEALCIVVRASRRRKDYLKMYRYALKDMAEEGVSEVCVELGEYYFEQKAYEEAAIWFYNAAYETHSILDVHCSGDIPLERLADCYEALGIREQALDYRRACADWRMNRQAEGDLK